MNRDRFESMKEPREFDPHKTMVPGNTLRRSGFVEHYGYPIYEDESGRKLYLVLDKPVQQFFASMLMGDIIARCEVMYDRSRGHFYSLSTPEEELGQKGSVNVDDVESDFAVLSSLFGTFDRALHTPQNYTISRGRAYNFDIALNAPFLLDTTGKESVRKVSAKFKTLTDTQKTLFKKKLRELLSRFGGNSGRLLMERMYRQALWSADDARKHTTNDYTLAPKDAPMISPYERFLRHGTDLNLDLGKETFDLFYKNFMRRIHYLAALT